MTYKVSFFTQPSAEGYDFGMHIVTDLTGIKQAGPAKVTYETSTSLRTALSNAGLPRELSEIGDHVKVFEVEGTVLQELGFKVSAE